MIEAAQARFLVAPECKRRPAVRTVLANDPEPAVRIAEDDEIFTEQPRTQRRSIGFGHFLRHADGQPVRAHQPAHC